MNWKLSEWNSFKDAVITAIYMITVAGDYKEVVKLIDEFFTLRPKIINLKIQRSYAGEKLVYNKEKLFVTLALYSGFAKYKLGDFDDALEVFNAFKDFSIPLKIDEGDYAGEIFGEFGGKISSASLIGEINRNS